MTRRGLATAAGAAVLFAVFLAVLFPTDALVRRLLARPGWPPVAFERARLRPDGLRLEGVAVRAPTGTLVRADRVRWKPSVGRLLRDGRGLPWDLEARVCDGAATATVTGEGPRIDVALAWRDADLTACPPFRIAGGTLAGRTDGDALVRLDPAASPVGRGTVDLRAARWRGAGGLAGFGAVRAETASIRWRMADGLLVLEAVDLSGPRLSLTGSGRVRLAEPLAESSVHLDLELPAGADGAARPLRVSVDGTLGAPSVVVQ